jgi:hypothetical protein
MGEHRDCRHVGGGVRLGEEGNRHSQVGHRARTNRVDNGSVEINGPAW